MPAEADIPSSAASIRGFSFSRKNKIDRHQDQTEQKTCDAKKAANTFLKDIPELFHQCWKRLLQIRHLFFHVRLNALAFGGGQLWLARRDCFGRRRSSRRFWDGGGSRLCMRRSRRRRSDEPVCKTCRCRFSAPDRQEIRTFDRIDRLDPQCSRGLVRYKQGLAWRNSRFVSRWSGQATRPIHRGQKKRWRKARATALVRLSVPRDIFVTSGSSR